MTLAYADTLAHYVHFVPIFTTLLSGVFFVVLLHRYAQRGGTHLLWWAGGVAAYGLGTCLESGVTIMGNSVTLTKAWYIAGALLGGYPLAQGTVFLLLTRRAAMTLTMITVPFIVIASGLVIMSPVNLDALEPTRPSGAILGWQWVRLLTPFINLYAVVFLIGGAILSSARYASSHEPGSGSRALGNALIAAGAILPGIGGSMAKAGLVEALYIGEFFGLLLIWAGYGACVFAASPRVAMATA